MRVSSKTTALIYYIWAAEFVGMYALLEALAPADPHPSTGMDIVVQIEAFVCILGAAYWAFSIGRRIARGRKYVGMAIGLHCAFWLVAVVDAVFCLVEGTEGLKLVMVLYFLLHCATGLAAAIAPALVDKTLASKEPS